jgi:hypothetical protein
MIFTRHARIVIVHAPNNAGWLNQIGDLHLDPPADSAYT